ncbi:MAG: Chaperone protein HscB [Fluviibacter phosphoraccumulans EoVTN8]
MSDASAAPAVAITADLLGADFFTLLGLPKRFELDTLALDARFRELQREVHPDRFAAADDAARRASMMLATQINAAYQTLCSPLKRASYLLEQAGIDIGAESNTAMSPEFLMSQMMWREQVADARGEKNLAELKRLQVEIADDIRDAYGDLANALDRDHRAQDAVEGVRRLMFLEKLREEIEDAVFALEDCC